MSCFKRKKKTVEVPYDDVNCPYSIKPSVLFKLNEDKDSDGLRSLGGMEALAKALASDVHSGLDPRGTGQTSVVEHRRVFGPNTYKQIPMKNFFMLCFENMKDPIILLLCAAALVSTVLGTALPEQRAHKEWMEGIAIWVAVLIVVCVGAGNDYQKDLQFRELNAQKDIIEVKVIRGGDTQLVPNVEIVVGDIVLLDTGDKLIADGVMIDGFHLVLDEASLTGESDPIKKSPDEDPWCRSGTQVSEGSGRMLVVAVGQSSEWGKTMALVGEAGDENTPLQDKLGDLAAAIGKIGLGVAVACFLALLIKWCVANKGFPLHKINDNGPVQFFLYAVTIVVVAIPEGLPLAVTIALAYSMKKMMRDNNFVRVLQACETMGGATAICSDKTGTLTENRMTVTEGWFSGVKLAHAPGASDLRPELLAELQMNFALNSKAFLLENGPDLMPGFVGNRTDCALLMLMRKWGTDYKKVRDTYEPVVVELYGFSSAKKMASVLVRRKDLGVLRLYNKGAAEWVLQRCSTLYNEYGEKVVMTEAVREELMQVVVSMASRGLRCICLTHADFAETDPKRPADFFADSENVDKDLVAMAIVGIKDPVRAEVPDAVTTCQKAGITVRMVTGDNIHTARHIARECGILDEGGVALEGPAFRNMNAAELMPLLPRLQVLARSSPEDKLVLVSLLKQEGEVVAVTGDGTNDAPALKESDVGLAMGISGTEVAKEAADIVIMDDNFSSIVKAVLWGRSVFNSIRKFLQFQLTVNVVALVVAFVGAVAGGRIPLNVLQLLWVNLIMDTMGALALATEDPNPALLDDKPHGRNEPLITLRMWKHILVQSAYQLFWLFFFMYALPQLMPHYGPTSRCAFIATGPEENWPGYCAATLESQLGYDAAAAATNCDYLLHCGFGCGEDMRTTAACPLAAAFPPGALPVDPDVAICGAAGQPAGCAAYTQFAAAQSYWDGAYTDEASADWIRVDSLLFNAFIMLQLANEINARRINDEYNVLEGLHRSPIFIGVLTITMAFQVIIMMTPVGTFFKVVPINGPEWGASMLIGVSAIPVSILTRFISRIMPSVRRRKHQRTLSGNRVHAADAPPPGTAGPRRSADRGPSAAGAPNASHRTATAHELALPSVAGGKVTSPV